MKQKPTVLISGASGNMGQAMVAKFLGEGFRVTGIVPPNDKIKMDISDPELTLSTVDLSNEPDTGKAIQELIHTNGSIDAAILTVGGFAMGDIAATSGEDISRQYQLNFLTAYHVVRPLFLHMMTIGRGKIFLVGSRPGMEMKTGKGMTAYALAKSLIFRLAELLNEEARGTDIVTTVIVPSTIDTPQNRAAMPDANFTQWVSPAAIAEAVYFYCTDQAAAIREPVIKLFSRS
jgi:NAD(P)-dependent dehydrogenase (short-subunit alcohol dehydrogenase family)